MSQLEPQLRAILRARLKDYLIEHKMTTVFVTHDQTEAIALADRIAVMEKGELQQFGTPAEIKQSPSNLFVASFIGEPPMNIFDAAIAPEGNATSISGLGPNGQPAFRLKAPAEAGNGTPRAPRHPPASDRDRRERLSRCHRQGHHQPLARRPEPHLLRDRRLFGGRCDRQAGHGPGR